MKNPNVIRGPIEKRRVCGSNRCRLGGSATALTLIAWGGVHAQVSPPPTANPTPTTLDAVQVTGNAAPKKTDLDADPASLPGSTTVVRQAEIARQSVQSYGDLLRPVTGLNVTNYGNGGLGYGFELRGYTTGEHGRDIAVFVDGVPINVSSGVQTNGYVDLNPLLPETISSFEVIRGPISALSGNHALGGTIYFTTATEAPPNRFDVSGGSYEYGRVSALHGFHGEGFQGYSVLETYTSAGYRDNEREKRFNLFNKLAFPLLSGTGSLRFQVFSTAYGEPEYINRAAVESGALSAKAADNPTDHGLHQQQNLVFNYQGNGEDFWSSTAYVVHNNLVRTRTTGGTSLPGSGTQRIDGDDRESFGGDIHRTTVLKGLGIPALVVSGASLYSDVARATRFATDRQGHPTVQSQDRHLDVYNAAVYTELQLKPIDRLKLTLGARYDKFYDHIKSGSADSIPNVDYSPKLGQFSPKAGAAFSILEGIELYANASRGLKAPSAYDELIANPNLAVSQVHAYETGVQGQQPS